MLSRRSLGKLAAALPLTRLPSSVATSIPTPGIGIQSRPEGEQGSGEAEFNPNVPKMPRWKALQTALADQAFAEGYSSYLFERERCIERLDPDLEVLRSFSPMAKITFQRQRNVERMLARDVQESGPRRWIDDALNRIMGRV